MPTTHPDAIALLAAIVANPAEDTPRLMYADLLQEEGDEERAEFIRVQVELARIAPDDWPTETTGLEECWPCLQRRRGGQCTNGPCRCTLNLRWLRTRERELLEANYAKWLKVECERCKGKGDLMPGRVYVREMCTDCNGTGDIGGLLHRTESNYDPASDTYRSTESRNPVTFRRGFPHSVGNVRLADVFERKLGEWHTSPDGSARARSHTGDWQPTAWALNVVRCFPTMQELPLVDRRAFQREPHDWLWHRGGDSPTHIPILIYDHLEGGHTDINSIHHYRTEADTHTALGRAVVKVLKAHPQK